MTYRINKLSFQWKNESIKKNSFLTQRFCVRKWTECPSLHGVKEKQSNMQKDQSFFLFFFTHHKAYKSCSQNIELGNIFFPLNGGFILNISKFWVKEDIFVLIELLTINTKFWMLRLNKIYSSFICLLIKKK